ncbi:MAG: UDP-3-O-[3-hydroxymyristoyl] glucosamine N-acyltransferase [Myxococcota bacterium]|jgi:UDP-3-O-[3-hydroxymyristoyl] glucosamine N-acyltransferase
MSVRWLILGLMGCGNSGMPDAWDAGGFPVDAMLERTMDTGYLDLIATVDECPDDPDKQAPGFCGCDYIDLDLAVPEGAETCVHRTAVIQGSVGAGATIGAGTLVAARAVVGEDADIGADVIIGRSASVGARSQLGPESVLSRASSIGEDVVASVGSLTLGYGASLGDRCQVNGTGVTLGNLAQVGADCWIDTGVVLARSSVIGNGAVLAANVMVGPGVQAGSGLDLGVGVRVRKDVEFGDNVTVELGARLGRSSYFGDGVFIGEDAVVRANVMASANAIIEANAYVVRNTIIPQRSLDPCDPPPGVDPSAPVVLSIPMTIGLGDTTYECTDLVVSSTVTVSGTHHFRSLTVQSGGNVTHAAGELDGVLLTISHNLDVRTGGSINVSGRGGLGGTGNSQGNLNAETWSPTGMTRVDGADEQAGGSYGAQGKRYTYGRLNAVYGDPRNPVELGSGGGIKNSGSGSGGRGGGRIDIIADNAVIDGILNADGTGCRASCGGGSGGAIRLRVTGDVSGSGNLFARGVGGSQGGSYAGSGGRIAVTGYASNGFIGDALGATVFFMGTDNAGTYLVNGVDAAMTVEVGETVDRLAVSGNGSMTVNIPVSRETLSISGTLVMNAPLTLTGTMNLGGQGSSMFNDTVSVGDWAQSGGSATFEAPVSATTWTQNNSTVTFNDTVTASGWSQRSGTTTLSALVDLAPTSFSLRYGTLVNEGTLTVPTFDTDTVLNGTLTNRGSLLITDDTQVVVGSNTTINQFGNFQGISRAPFTVSALTVQANGDIQQLSQHTDGLILNVLGQLDVQLNGTINVTGAGGLGGTGNSQGNLNAETWSPTGMTRVDGADEQAGGSYGAQGKRYTYGRLNAVYGDPRNPVELGSGGGIKNSGSGSGGRGGGRINITAGSAIINGELIANGTGCGASCGGGSGGAIRLRVTGAVSGNGALFASGVGGSQGGSYAGSGGRIAVTGYTSGSFTGATDAGTVFLMGTDHVGTYRVNGVEAALTVEADETIQSVAVSGNGSLTVNIPMSTDTLSISGTLTMNAPLTLTGTMNLGGQGSSVFHDSVSIGDWVQSGGSATFEAPISATTWTQKNSTVTFNNTVTASGWSQQYGTTTLGALVDLAPTSFSLRYGTLINEGTLTVPTLDTNTVLNGTLTNRGSLLIADDTHVVVGSNTTINQFGELRGVARAPFTVNALTVQGNGDIQQLSQYTDGLILHVLGQLDVQVNGTINVTGAGGLGGVGNSQGNLDAETWSAAGPTRVGGADEQAGGSYGSAGRRYRNSTLNTMYGDPLNPVEYGSGGGIKNTEGSRSGGRGGGRIDLTAGSAIVDGQVLANGGNCYVSCGAGSGGAIRLQVTEALSGTGEVLANGGVGTNGGSYAGGGGRVALTAGDFSAFTGTTSGGTVAIDGVVQ